MITTCEKHEREYVKDYCSECKKDFINSWFFREASQAIGEKPASDWVEFSEHLFPIYDSSNNALMKEFGKLVIYKDQVSFESIGEKENMTFIRWVNKLSKREHYAYVKETVVEVMEKIQ